MANWNHRPFSLIIISVFGSLFAFVAIATDTAFYSGPPVSSSFRALLARMYTSPVITPLNNLRYNSQSSNLALHGLHPHYQHLVANMPQLLGPAMVLLVAPLWPFSLKKLRWILTNPCLTSAFTGTLILSLIPHQEPRFLLPCIPLLLSCIRLPRSPRWRRNFWASWILFNSFMSILMGIYHQGGVVPTQIAISRILPNTNVRNATVFWWKTYPPPTYLLGALSTDSAGSIPLNVTTVPLMGMSTDDVRAKLFGSSHHADCYGPSAPLAPPSSAVFLVAPLSAHLFDDHSSALTRNRIFLKENHQLPHEQTLALSPEWVYYRHLNLDDIDFPEDGVWATLSRVVGRRGLGVWRVQRDCDGT